MKVKTNDLTDEALDYAVAKAEGFKHVSVFGAWRNTHGARGNAQVMVSNKKNSLFAFWPSKSWGTAGPIIEREGISVQQFDGSALPERRWNAYMPGDVPLKAEEEINGPTPLVAAMRCYVASKLGTEVDAPAELFAEPAIIAKATGVVK